MTWGFLDVLNSVTGLVFVLCFLVLIYRFFLLAFRRPFLEVVLWFVKRGIVLYVTFAGWLALVDGLFMGRFDLNNVLLVGLPSLASLADRLFSYIPY